MKSIILISYLLKYFFGRKKKRNLNDTILFESPVKKKKKKAEKKSIQKNLFGEIFCTPPQKIDLDDSVIKPNKAYHTPDSFKTHLIKMKRNVQVPKKVTKKVNFSKIKCLCKKFDYKL